MKHSMTSLLASALCAASLAFANMGSNDASDLNDQNWIDGKKAVEAQDWKRAVDLLGKAAAANPQNADVQNSLGFAQRKSGNLDAAFAAYNEALKLNPKHKQAHEYIGEAFLMKGDIGHAEQHLAELQKLCTPIPCEEYNDLRRAVDDFKKKKK